MLVIVEKYNLKKYKHVNAGPKFSWLVNYLLFQSKTEFTIKK